MNAIVFFSIVLYYTVVLNLHTLYNYLYLLKKLYTTFECLKKSRNTYNVIHTYTKGLTLIFGYIHNKK